MKSKKTKRNKYPQIFQAEIDLHGLNKEEARIALSDFLNDSRNRGYKFVRVITGKGLHSPGNIGILKDYVKDILSEVGLKYSEAKISEGGSGAFCVRL